MKIAVGIPTFRRPEVLVRTCEEVLRQNHPAVCEVIIADQTPWDEIEKNWQDAIVRLQRHEHIHYHTLQTPNLPAARNFILQQATGDIVLWIDDDVLLPAGFIGAHYHSYAAGRCGRPVIAVAGNPVHRIVRVPDERKINFENYKDYCAPHFSTPSGFVCDWRESMIGVNHSVLRLAAMEAGGYDENFSGSAGCEDTDFTCRLRKHFPEKLIAYNPDAWLIHLRSQAGGCRIEKKNKWSEYDAVIGPHICYKRHRRGISIFQSFRMSPLRRENVVGFWRQPRAWYDFFRSLIHAYQLKSRVKSPFNP